MGLKQRYEVIERVHIGHDTFNTPLYEDKVIKTIEMIIVPKEFKTVTEGLLSTETKYLGLTTDKTFKKGMKVQSKTGAEVYSVENVNNIARLAQITMKRIEYDGD